MCVQTFQVFGWKLITRELNRKLKETINFIMKTEKTQET